MQYFEFYAGVHRIECYPTKPEHVGSPYYCLLSGDEFLGRAFTAEECHKVAARYFTR